MRLYNSKVRSLISKIKNLSSRMINCFQTKNQNILEHGESVWKNTNKILSNDYDTIKVPDWFRENYSKLICLIPKERYQQIKEYNIFHDCGKPLCLQIDANGKRHFPNHSEVSFKTYLEYFSDNYVANLIRLDMIMHIESYETIINRKLSMCDLTILFITALAEINSNAEMFGGIESVNFKIKFKKLNKIGKKIFKEVLKK